MTWDDLRIDQLFGGGVVLGYRCPSRCRHCLYGAGPKRRDGGGEGRRSLGEVLDLLAERAPYAAYHIGGGEPFLDPQLLRDAIGGLLRRGLSLEYVETNAFWATSRESTEETLRELADVGLRCLLVSVSPFHAEFVPPDRTLRCIEAAQKVLPGGVFPWIAELIGEITEGDPRSLLDLDARIARRGASYAVSLVERYGLVPGGRAGRWLHRHGVRRPWREVASEIPCRRRLVSTGHFHVDLDGMYVPGLCAGLVLPLREVPGRLSLDTRPVLRALLEGGPAALVELAEPLGFEPAETYGSACDLCGDVRAFLYAQGYSDRAPELGPGGFYEHFAVAAHAAERRGETRR